MHRPEDDPKHPRYEDPDSLFGIISIMIRTPTNKLYIKPYLLNTFLAYKARKRQEAFDVGEGAKYNQYIVTELVALVQPYDILSRYDPIGKAKDKNNPMGIRAFVHNEVVFAISRERREVDKVNKFNLKAIKKGAVLDIEYRHERSKPGPASEQGDFVLESFINEMDSVEDAMYWKEIKQYISDYLDPKFDKKREVQVEKGLVFSMRIDGYRSVEIAEVMGRSPEYTRLYFTRKRKGLLKYLKKVGLTEDDLPYDMIKRVKEILGE